MSASTPAEVDPELVKVFEKYNQHAYLQSDVEALDSVLADDWLLTTADGQHKYKAEQLREVEKGFLKVYQCDVSDVNYRVYGETAVVTGRRMNKVIFNKEDVSALTHFTQVYVKKGGNWRCVNTQVTRIR
jgi:hypothetical protein